MAELEQITVKFTARFEELERSLDQIQRDAEKATAKIKRTFDKLGQDLQRIGRRMTLGVTTPIIALGVLAIKAASDVEEMRALLRVTFGEATDDVEAWAEATGEAVGRSRFSLLQFAGDFASFLKPLGTAEEALAPMSKALTQLTVDLASFRNLAEEQVFVRLMSGLAGETEAVRRMGIDLGQAALEAELLSMGITTAAKDVDQATKVMARFNIIMRQTQDAQGDAIRTADGLANATRRMSDTWKDVSVQLGQILLPIAKQIVAVITELGQAFLSLNSETQKWIIVAAAAAAAIGPLLIGLGLLIRTVVIAARGLAVLGVSLASITRLAAGLASGFMVAQGGLVDDIGVLESQVENISDGIGRRTEALRQLTTEWQRGGQVDEGARSQIADLISQIEELRAARREVSAMIDQRRAAANNTPAEEDPLDELDGMSQTIEELLTQLDNLPTGTANIDDLGGAAGRARDKLEATTLALETHNTMLGASIEAYKNAGNGASELSTVLNIINDSYTIGEEAIRQNIDLTTDLGQEWVRAAGSNARLQRELQAVADIYNATRTPLEIFTATVARLNHLLDRGAISWDLYLRALEDADEALANATQTTSDFEVVAGQMGDALGSAFEDAVVSGNSLRDVLQGLEQDLLRIFMRQVVMQPLMGALFGTGDEGGGLFGDLFGGLFSAKGNAFNNGRVSAFAQGGVVNGTTAFPMAGGRMGIMGEAGPEAVMPLQRTSSGKLGVSAIGQSVVNVQVHNNVADVASSSVSQSPNAGGGLDVAVMIDKITAENVSTPGTQTNRALTQGRFSLPQQTIAR